MRIYFVETDGAGGLIHFAYEVCQALAAEGHDVSLLTSDDYELGDFQADFKVVPLLKLWQRTASADQSRRRTLRKLKHAGRRAVRGARLTWQWGRLTGHILRDPPDLVIFSEINFPHLASFLAVLKQRGVHLAQVCHEFAYQEREGAKGISSLVGKAMSASIYRQFETIYFLSEATRREFLTRYRFPAERTFWIAHGEPSMFPEAGAADVAAVRSELQLAADEPVILFFGSIRPSKGLPLLIEAFAESSCRDRARLVIVGAPSRQFDMAAVKARVAEAGLASRVSFCLGYTPNDKVGAYFAVADCVALPYETATQSAVLHLAYKFGRACIATSVGGLAENVRDGETGYLVTPGDSHALATALDRAIINRENTKSMGRSAKRLIAKEYTWARTAKIITNTSFPGYQQRAAS